MVPYVSHVEWYVTDLARSEAFFTQLFGWSFVAFSTHYRLYTPSHGTCVGLMETSQVIPTNTTLIHIYVDNLDYYLAKALVLGATLHTPRTTIPNYGDYAQVRDFDGHIVGLFQPSSS